MNKYKINLNELERQGGIDKLRRDGFTNEQIHKAMYHETDGATRQQREKLMEKLHDRR